MGISFEQTEPLSHQILYQEYFCMLVPCSPQSSDYPRMQVQADEKLTSDLDPHTC